MIGYPASKVRYLVNRADSPGGIEPGDLERALGRVPEHRVVRDGLLVVQSNNEGVPFVLANPAAPISQDLHRIAAELLAANGIVRPAAAGRRYGRPMSDPRPIGVFDSGVGGLTVLREILRRSPHESTIYLGDNLRAPYGVRPDEEVRAFSIEALDELAARDVKAIVVACNTSTAVALGDFRRRYDLPILGVVRPGAVTAALTTRNRRVGVIATPATVRSHAYFNAIKDENPAVEVYEHATPAFVPLVEAGRIGGPEVEAIVAESLAPLLGERDAAGEFVFPLPPSARIDTLLLGCTHYPLLRPVIARDRRRAAWRSSIRRRPPPRRSSSCSRSTVSRRRARRAARLPTRGGRPRSTGRDRGEPTHVQLTTGDVDAFRAVAERIFGEAFPDVGSVEVGRVARVIGHVRPDALAAGARRAGARQAGLARRPRLAGRVPRRLGARCRGDGPQPARRAGRSPGPRRLARRGTVRRRAAPLRARAP